MYAEHISPVLSLDVANSGAGSSSSISSSSSGAQSPSSLYRGFVKPDNPHAATAVGNTAEDARPHEPKPRPQQQQQQQHASENHAPRSADPAAPSPAGAAASVTTAAAKAPATTKPRDEFPGVPADFNWQQYLLRYPDLRAANLRTERGARWHYSARGRQERRTYARIPVLLRYTACQGLFNQMYAHLNALLLAEYLGADVVLPPSVYRESFSKYFSMSDPKRNQVKWTPTDTGALLDVQALKTTYAKKGMVIHETPEYTSFPDCMHPHDAFPQYLSKDVSHEQIVQLPFIYLQSMPLWTMWDAAAERIHAKRAELASTGRHNATIVLDLPCPFLSIMTLTCLDDAAETARALKFNRTLVTIAGDILRGMAAAGVGEFNGAHLRLERDAMDWAKMLGGMDAYLEAYRQAFMKAEFSTTSHMYIASGLLSYNASQEMGDMLRFLRPFARNVHYKEKYVPPETLRSLNPEQQALVDFLVLSASRRFVGLGSSTFSVYLREHRVLHGKPQNADVFVDTSKIGTDGLFERCTHFAPLPDKPTASSAT